MGKGPRGRKSRGPAISRPGLSVHDRFTHSVDNRAIFSSGVGGPWANGAGASLTPVPPVPPATAPSQRHGTLPQGRRFSQPFSSVQERAGAGSPCRRVVLFGMFFGQGRAERWQSLPGDGSGRHVLRPGAGRRDGSPCRGVVPVGMCFGPGAGGQPAVPARERFRPPFSFLKKRTGRGRSKRKTFCRTGTVFLHSTGFSTALRSKPEQSLLLAPRVPLRYALLRREMGKINISSPCVTCSCGGKQVHGNAVQ